MNPASRTPHYRPEERQAVTAELERVLNLKRFSSAPQMSAFLRYIVTETLAGNAERIKAYSVGVDALGKPSTFDAQNDPSVRVLALRLRKTLNLIYASSVECHAVIELKVGTYVPEFFPAPNLTAANTDHASQTSSIGSETQPPELVVVKRTAESSLNNSVSKAMHSQEKLNAISEISTKFDGKGALSAEKKTAPSIKAPTILTLFLLSAALFWLGLSGSRDAMSETSAFSANPALDFPVSQLSADATAVDDLFDAEPPVTPTLYLSHPSVQTQYEQDLSVLIGTSLMQAGIFNVVRPVNQVSYPDSSEGNYQVLVSEFLVEGESRVDAQLINLATGEIVLASTLTPILRTGEPKTDVLDSIKQFALELSDRTGPLFRDFLALEGSQSMAVCKYLETTET